MNAFENCENTVGWVLATEWADPADPTVPVTCVGVVFIFTDGGVVVVVIVIVGATDNVDVTGVGTTIGGFVVIVLEGIDEAVGIVVAAKVTIVEVFRGDVVINCDFAGTSADVIDETEVEAGAVFVTLIIVEFVAVAVVAAEFGLAFGWF